MNETSKQVKRSELWNKIFDIVSKIPRKEVQYDAVDAPSATTLLEEMLIKNYKIKNK